MTKFWHIALICLLSCKGSPKSESATSSNDSTAVNDRLIDTSFSNNLKKQLGLTHNPDLDTIWFKPVSFYLNDENCSPLAKDFYFGKLRPADDSITALLLMLGVTNNNNLRPFYRWCLNATILVQDGALAEMTGVPARRYVEKFPKEFLEYTKNKKYGSSSWNWSEAIHYSGYYPEEVSMNSFDIYNRYLKQVRINCINCTVDDLNEIELFGRMAF